MQSIRDFITDEDFKELSDKPRIMLVAREFRAEVTSSVKWLRDQFGMDISCLKWDVYELPGKDGRAGPKIGVLNLPSFYADMRGGDGAKSLTRDTERLIGALKKRGLFKSWTLLLAVLGFSLSLIGTFLVRSGV